MNDRYETRAISMFSVYTEDADYNARHPKAYKGHRRYGGTNVLGAIRAGILHFMGEGVTERHYRDFQRLRDGHQRHEVLDGPEH